MAKRVLDVAVASLVLLSLSPLLTIVAFAIRLAMGRPILYRQLRIGKSGKPFWLYKFRTMRPNRGGAVITTGGDPRITPLGNFLRRWKIDELPQFWNILHGNMSLIGPRPEAESLVRYYTEEQRRLLEQTPGLASMSQLVYPHEVEFLRGHPNPEELYRKQLMPKKLAVDLDYERRRTFFSDLRLMFELALLIIIGKSNRIDHSLISRSAERTVSSEQA
jgi:lipopolysaccharide/colanic/teichoic acid biosynthesis glycosyltransferase